MKKIIIYCSPASLFTISTIDNNDILGVVPNISFEQLGSMVFAQINKDTKILIKGNHEYTQKIKEKLQKEIISYNSTFSVDIELI
jgi:predicted phosphohydrolase